MAISSDFQKRIVELADDSDLSRTELKNKMQINSSFNNALNYGIIPTPKILIKIADYFQVSLGYLLGYDTENDFVPSTSNKSFSDRFAELCNEKSVTHYRVGTDCGFDKSLISRWFSKNYLPSLEIAELIAGYFKVSLDYLFGRSDYRN